MVGRFLLVACSVYMTSKNIKSLLVALVLCFVISELLQVEAEQVKIVTDVVVARVCTHSVPGGGEQVGQVWWQPSRKHQTAATQSTVQCPVYGALMRNDICQPDAFFSPQ